MSNNISKQQLDISNLSKTYLGEKEALEATLNGESPHHFISDLIKDIENLMSSSQSDCKFCFDVFGSVVQYINNPPDLQDAVDLGYLDMIIVNPLVNGMLFIKKHNELWLQNLSNYSSTFKFINPPKILIAYSLENPVLDLEIKDHHEIGGYKYKNIANICQTSTGGSHFYNLMPDYVKNSYIEVNDSNIKDLNATKISGPNLYSTLHCFLLLSL